MIRKSRNIEEVKESMRLDRERYRAECSKWLENFTTFFNESIQDFQRVEKHHILVYMPLRTQTMIQNAMLYAYQTLESSPDFSVGHCDNGLMEAQYKGQQIHFHKVRIVTGYEEAFIMVAPHYTYKDAYFKRQPLTDFQP